MASRILSRYSLSLLRPLSSLTLIPKTLIPKTLTLDNTRLFSTRNSTSSLNDPNPNWSNRPPKETILLDGCDFEHWLCVVEKPSEDMTRDDIIRSYIKTLAQVVGTEEEARMKIYSVSTKHYFAFGALVSEELSYKIKELPGVRWVLPDSYLDVRNKDYGGEPFINGEAVPYDAKYHANWVKNNARANERNRRNDRPRNLDRSSNFERRRENVQDQNQGFQGNQDGPRPAPNMGPATHNPNMGAVPPNNMRPSNVGPNNMMPNNRGPNNMPPNNMNRNNMGPNMSPNNFAPNNMMQNNAGRVPQNMGYQPNNMGGAANNAPNFQYSGGPSNGGPQYQNRDMRGTPQQDRDFLQNYDPNAPAGNNFYQPQDMCGPPQQNRNFLQDYEPKEPAGNNSYQPQNVYGRA